MWSPDEEKAHERRVKEGKPGPTYEELEREAMQLEEQEMKRGWGTDRKYVMSEKTRRQLDELYSKLERLQAGKPKLTLFSCSPDETK